MDMKLLLSLIIVFCISLSGCSAQQNIEEYGEIVEKAQDNSTGFKDLKHYTMPVEESEHKGTFLQWPHEHTYGLEYKKELVPIWVTMATELSKDEEVNIIVYDESSKQEVVDMLADEKVDLTKIKFFVYETDDVWVRDNGPIFAHDSQGDLVMLDFGFNGWGEKTEYKKCLQIPTKLSKELGFARIDIHDFVLEGGSIELDGSGTLITTRSSVTNQNRNPNLSEKEIEEYFKKYFSVSNIVWLDGVSGLDITDFHIDGFAKFFDDKTLITLNENDLEEWGVEDSDINIIAELSNVEGKQYDKVYLPLTKNNVVLDNGKKLDYKGSYINYYIGNGVVLVPNYNDANDEVANNIIQELYPDRKVVGIDIRNLYQYGGMIHCVTQQQPME